MPGNTIAELKNVDITSFNNYYGLEKWYINMLSKKISELNLRDISTMLRQDVYVDIALPIVWRILCESPFEGEMWEGQLLELLIKYFADHKSALDSIECNSFLENLDEKIEKHEWDSEEKKEKYREYVARFDCLVKDRFPNKAGDPNG